MPTTIDPAAGETFPANLTGPADGDLANAASVNVAFQSIMNGVDLARQGLFGFRLRPRYYVSQVGNGGATHPTVTVEPLGRIVLTTGGGVTWGVLAHTVTTVVDLQAAFGGLIPVKTRVYLYAYNNAGAIGWVANTTPPAGDLRYGASTDQVYIGTFLSDPTTAGVIYQCWEYGGIHQIGEAGAAGTLPILSAGSANGLNALACYNVASRGQIVPPFIKHIRFAVLGNYLTGTDTLGVAGGSGGNGYEFFVNNESANVCGDITLVSEDGTNIYYGWNTGGAGRSASIGVSGWIDPR